MGTAGSDYREEEVMDPRRKRLLDSRFNEIVNYAYCQPHPELPDSPKEAFERYNKLLDGRK